MRTCYLYHGRPSCSEIFIAMLNSPFSCLTFRDLTSLGSPQTEASCRNATRRSVSNSVRWVLTVTGRIIRQAMAAMRSNWAWRAILRPSILIFCDPG